MSNIRWEGVFSEYPDKASDAAQARELILNISSKSYHFTAEDSNHIWTQIEKRINTSEAVGREALVIPIHSGSVLKRNQDRTKRIYRMSQELKVAGILILVICCSMIYHLVFDPKPSEFTPPVEVMMEEFSTPMGVKSSLTLSDGTKVLLNSGSSIRFVKNFESDKRDIFLVGEGYFEVAKDPNRPFAVHTGVIKSIALGTAFNISAYPNERMQLSLLEGKVAIQSNAKSSFNLTLNPGDGVRLDLETGATKRIKFDPDLVLAWTQKKIIFNHTGLPEAIRVLENWYGVKFIFENRPDPKVKLVGAFQDELLENVLLGLSYTARFEFKIVKDTVYLTFN